MNIVLEQAAFVSSLFATGSKTRIGGCVNVAALQNAMRS